MFIQNDLLLKEVRPGHLRVKGHPRGLNSSILVMLGIVPLTSSQAKALTTEPLPNYE